MQQALFASEGTHNLATAIEVRRTATVAADHSRGYCIKEILYEEYLWDMRCWHKRKYEYSKLEVCEHIRKWIKDHKEGNWTNNCGHCLYCIRKLLYNKWATPEEIASYVLKNNNIKYPNEINTWGNGIDEFSDQAEQVNDYLA